MSSEVKNNIFSAVIGAAVGTLISGIFSYISVVESAEARIELEKIKISEKREEKLFSASSRLLSLGDQITRHEFSSESQGALEELRFEHYKAGNEIILILGVDALNNLSAYSDAFEQYISASVADDPNLPSKRKAYIEQLGGVLDYLHNQITETTKR